MEKGEGEGEGVEKGEGKGESDRDPPRPALARSRLTGLRVKGLGFTKGSCLRGQGEGAGDGGARRNRWGRHGRARRPSV